MLKWISSFISPTETPKAAPKPLALPEASSPPPPSPPGYDAEKAKALSSYEVKTRAAYALTMHGYHSDAHRKLSSREPLTPEVIEYAKGPGCETLRRLGQALTILAEAAGEIEVPDGNGGLITVQGQLEQFRATFPELAPPDKLTELPARD